MPYKEIIYVKIYKKEIVYLIYIICFWFLFYKHYSPGAINIDFHILFVSTKFTFVVTSKSIIAVPRYCIIV